VCAEIDLFDDEEYYRLRILQFGAIGQNDGRSAIALTTKVRLVVCEPGCTTATKLTPRISGCFVFATEPIEGAACVQARASLPNGSNGRGGFRLRGLGMTPASAGLTARARSPFTIDHSVFCPPLRHTIRWSCRPSSSESRHFHRGRHDRSLRDAITKWWTRPSEGGGRYQGS
jgi:hypothetical protein